MSSILLPKIDKRISELQQGIVGLTALADENESGKPQSMMDVLAGVGVETGLTDAVRMITSSFGFPMTPKQVRDALLHLDYNLSGYSNILASLHTIMKRLATSGELIKVVDDQGNEIGAYAWNPAVAVRRQKPGSTEVLAALDRAIVRLADGIEPSQPPVAEVDEAPKNNSPDWYNRIAESGPIGYKKPTRKQQRLERERRAAQSDKSAVAQIIEETGRKAFGSDATARDQFLKNLEETTKKRS